MQQRNGKFGAFLGCTTYPTCKHTQPVVGDVSSIEDNIEVCNEIQPCIGDYIEFDETTGFLDNNKTIDKEENFNNSL